MESLARLVVIMILVLLALGPLALVLAFFEKTPFIIVLFFGILAISAGVYWSTIPTAARWMGLIPILLGGFAIFKRLNL